MKSKKTKIMVIVISLVALALIAGAIVAVILLNKEDNACTDHIDENADGKCDICGADMSAISTDQQYEDKLEAISKFYITAAEGEGYVVTVPEYVIKGKSFSFEVKFSNYFDSTNAVVSANGSEVKPLDDGKYTVENVQDDIEITVSGLVRTYYGVIKNVSPGVNVIGEDRVAVDGDYSFTLDMSDNVSGTPVVKANGKTISPTDGVYTVSTPNENLVVEVSGLTAPMVELSYDDIKGYTVEYDPTVVGNTLNFSIHLNSEYENHIPLVVRANGEVIKAVNGIYTIENAPQSVNIVVEGMQLREKITITFVNCDLEPTTIYKATAWQEITPVRDGYIFNGWTNELGQPVKFDYLSDVTIYASWITEDGIDYVKELPAVVSDIRNRHETIGEELWRLNVSDKALAERYVQLLAYCTEFEKTLIVEDPIVNDFLEKKAFISDEIVGKNSFYGENENAVRLFFTVDGELTNKGASMLRALSNGDELDGIRYNIQNKNAANETILDYSLNFGNFNFKELCDKNGKVTFWLSTNAPDLVASVGNEYLFVAANNTAVASGGTCALYRVDVQNQMVFVNGEYLFDLSEAEYTGESEFAINVHRFDEKSNPSHQYAYIAISNIYTGAKDPSLIKVIKTHETVKITSMLHASSSYVIPETGLNTFTRHDSSGDMFGEIGGDKYNLQKPSTNAEDIILDYKFTIQAFNFKRYCDKYGSISFMMATNYADQTASIGGLRSLHLRRILP